MNVRSTGGTPVDLTAGIRKVAELIVPTALRTQVRVVGRSSQAALQFQRISHAVGYDSRLAYSLSEAEGLLDGPG